jgi:hypothetical protein
LFFIIQHCGWVIECTHISLWLWKFWDKFRNFFVLLLKLLGSMILAMEIVWFIGFWCCSMSFAIYLLSLIKERKGFIGGQHEKISIDFRSDEVCWFLV